MQDPKRAKFHKLCLWIVINLVIFVACYLNYRLHLKHRYLYKTLNVGLCFSRAAAMVINFNLLLVWLPMCKYTLTRLAVLASNSITYQKNELKRLISTPNKVKTIDTIPTFRGQQAIVVTVDKHSRPENHKNNNYKHSNSHATNILCGISKKASWQVRRFTRHVRYVICWIKIKTISNFLTAADNSTSLHTVCATTITLASVVHTVAHLMNVINFSNKFDPLLSNLNMAEYKGQNPLQLLVSVPGITGCLMIVILFLMSLSSTSIIRNSSYDLFQVFHRLSILFVILLILHPSSHVLKEQSNVSRHNPDLCYDRMVTTIFGAKMSERRNSTTTNVDIAPLSRLASLSVTENSLSIPQHAPEMGVQQGQATGLQRNRRHLHVPSEMRAPTASSAQRVDNATRELRQLFKDNLDNLTTNLSEQNTNSYNYGHQTNTSQLFVSKPLTISKQSIDNVNLHHLNSRTNLTDSSSVLLENNDDNHTSESKRVNNTNSDIDHEYMTLNSTHDVHSQTSSYGDEPCLDLKPLFVAQSSICWYVLGAGLSCYLFDLAFRRLRRSRNSVQLLNARTDAEGNLIELVLSNNHKRFTHWLPGQYVYLNCPQIAANEWHPFTISSMNNKTRQFTLHIKTGGDWTRKLREELSSVVYKQYEQQDSHQHNSMSLFFNQVYKFHQDHAMHKKHATELLKSPLYFIDHSWLGQSNKRAAYDIKTDAVCCAHNASTTELASIKNNKYSFNSHHILNQHSCEHGQSKGQLACTNDCVQTKLDYAHLPTDAPAKHSKERYSLYSNMRSNSNVFSEALAIDFTHLNLFIDGPFHSPFERLLEQQVSVCIANGVGWTAFSSIFQRITENLLVPRIGTDCLGEKVWWYKWRQYLYEKKSTCGNAIGQQYSIPSNETVRRISRRSNGGNQLHLIIIVTTIEQLRPFYHIALAYFQHVQDVARMNGWLDDRSIDPIQEVTAFLTRSDRHDLDVTDFCRQEKLELSKNHEADDSIEVNEAFRIRFGRPNLREYLYKLSGFYVDKRKISVYCCGSYHVKQEVQEICRSLNKQKRHAVQPFYCYHEENF